MSRWRFTEYVTEEGVNHIRDWYAGQDDGVRAEFDVTVGILRETEDWLDPETDLFKLLTGRQGGLGLGELRLWIEEQLGGGRRPRKRRFRPIGVYLPEQHEFIFILGCEKIGMNTIPLLNRAQETDGHDGTSV